MVKYEGNQPRNQTLENGFVESLCIDFVTRWFLSFNQQVVLSGGPAIIPKMSLCLFAAGGGGVECRV